MKEKYNDLDQKDLIMMEEENCDRTLHQLFDGFRPEMKSGKDFMNQLQTRMDAIEYVRQLQAREQNRSRRAMLCAFGGGLVVGGMLYAILMSGGASMPSTAVETQFVLLRIINEYSHLFACLIFSIIALAGIIIATSLWQDMSSLRDARDIMSSSLTGNGTR